MRNRPRPPKAAASEAADVNTSDVTFLDVRDATPEEVLEIRETEERARAENGGAWCMRHAKGLREQAEYALSL